MPTKRLESTIGRLNHAGHVIPQGRYFVNRLRNLLTAGKKFGPQKINQHHRKDLELWQKLLQNVSTSGININNITFTKPTHTTFSDACEHGMGGFCTNGVAWRYELPTEQVGKFSINLLEFLAAAITISLTTREAATNTKILAYTDSSSALGWLHKASFSSNQPDHDKIARWLALELMETGSALYSQHIRGKFNFVADSLSRDHHIANDKLTSAFRTLLPEQVHENFSIYPPPPEALYLMHSLFQLSTNTVGLPQQPTRSKLGVLTGGKDSWVRWASTMNGLEIIHEKNEHICCPLSRALADEIYTVRQTKYHLPEGQSSPPSHMFVRPFGRIFGQIQP